MDAQQLQETLDFAVASAKEAGQLTLEYYQKGTVAEMKADNSPVTIADRSAEELLRQRIESAYPTHGILGEEFGEKDGSDPARWILDPIDGTISFVSGVPLYSVLMGLEYDGQMVVGVAHFPALDETVYAARGRGCFWNGAATRVSDVRDLSQARLTYTSIRLAEQFDRAAEFDRLRHACGIERGWSDAYGYALLATGRAEVAVDPIMHIWDNAALLPIVTEAGGTFTDWSGQPTHTQPEALATNGHVLEAVLALIRG